MTSDSVRETLAANLRRARLDAGISLSELARRSTIGKATLSALETGSGNPTIETVFSLSRSLDVAISELLEPSSSAGVTVVRAAGIEVLAGAGVDLRPLQTLDTGEDTRLEIYDQTVRAGCRQDSLGHAGTEHTIVQVGRLGVLVDGAEHELGPGDYIRFDGRLPHAYTSLTSDDVHSVLLLQYQGRSDATTPLLGRDGDHSGER